VAAIDEVRDRSTQALVEALRAHGTLTRAELGQMTGLSRATVASIVDELVTRGLLLTTQSGAGQGGSRGRPPATVRFHPRAGVALGISMERENLQVALLDLSLNILAHRSLEFDLDPPVDKLLEMAAELCDEALRDPGTDRGELIGVGVGVPRPVDPRTGAIELRNRTQQREGHDAEAHDRFTGYDVESTLAARLGVPVMIENDANVAALAEAAIGAGRGRDTVIFIRASWGIGGAVLRRGRLYRGRTGSAGEFAHIRVRDDGPVCGCGRRGCLGPLAAGWAVRRVLEPALGRTPTLREVAELAAGGHVGARRVLADSGRLIGKAIAGTCLALNPDAVIVGGDLVGEGSPMLDGLRQSLQMSALPASVQALSVLPARLGPNAGALGAAGMVLHSPAGAAHLAQQL
jgi:predicted NBD/HSP70 family sugar kinase